MTLTLAIAQAIIKNTLAHGVVSKFKPLGAVVLDVRGAVLAAAISDGSSLARFDVARAKAKGALAFNMGTRALEKIAKDRPHLLMGVVAAIDGGIVPVPGGVLIRDEEGSVLGAIGVSGDTSDNDEAAALAGISVAGLVGDGGQG
jgi:uncharacterized protein GlcG (DUF336 family)